MKKIGILGGTFNPIHTGHLILAQNAADYCNLDKVIFIPSGISYFKNQNEIVSSNHRINMVKEAISNNEKFELSTIETDKDGNSYTYETIEQLKQCYEDTQFYYIFGADTLFSIEYWKKPEIIFKNTIIVCAKRNNYTDDELESKKDELINRFGGNIVFMDYPQVEISSSLIRNILKNKKSARYYLPEKVREYINYNKLY